MKIYYEDIPEISHYIEANKDIKLDDYKNTFDVMFERIRKFRDINRDSKILEIGVGIGYFPLLCKKEGITCKGLEISPQLIEFARQLGQKYGIEPDIELGNIEETDIGTSEYDVIVAETVFEHVEHWQKGLKRVFNALKTGGVLVFVSTNKFSLKSTEYNFPFYGWLPDKWRYWFRRRLQGDDIMKLGIDFNQFTYSGLRRFFKETGFSNVLDRVEFVDPEVLANPSRIKKILINSLKRARFLKPVVLFFSPVTSFICIK